MNLEKLAIIIRDARTRANFSSTKVAEILSVSPAYYSRIETGKAKPSRLLLKNIAFTLGIEDERLNELYEAAGYLTTGPDVSLIESLESDTTEEAWQSSTQKKPPIYFADIMNILISDNGVTLEFGQRAGSSRTETVARIGLSARHADKIQKVIRTELDKAKEFGIDI